MSKARLDPRRVQQALVCMLFDPIYTALVYGDEELPELSARERELLRAVDHRALATDDMRQARALHAIIDEYPVSAAWLGLDAVERYFSSPAFRACVFERGSMALHFGEVWLGERARGVGTIETTLARTRRRLPRQGSGLARARGVEVASVPAGSLAWYQRARARLGDEPLPALARLRKPWSRSLPTAKQPPRRGEEHLLALARPDGSLELGTASQPLVELLRAADPPRPRAELARVAIELGAEPGEAGELLDDLRSDGLLDSDER